MFVQVHAEETYTQVADCLESLSIDQAIATISSIDESGQRRALLCQLLDEFMQSLDALCESTSKADLTHHLHIDHGMALAIERAIQSDNYMNTAIDIAHHISIDLALLYNQAIIHGYGREFVSILNRAANLMKTIRGVLNKTLPTIETHPPMRKAMFSLSL